MDTKYQSFTRQDSAVEEFEGAITSPSNIRPDEIILRLGPQTASIVIVFVNGKKIVLPLHWQPIENQATLVVPEKVYKEAEKEIELNALLSGLFDNQRNLEVEMEIQDHQMTIQPLESKKQLFKFSFHC